MRSCNFLFGFFTMLRIFSKIKPIHQLLRKGEREKLRNTSFKSKLQILCVNDVLLISTVIYVLYDFIIHWNFKGSLLLLKAFWHTQKSPLTHFKFYSFSYLCSTVVWKYKLNITTGMYVSKNLFEFHILRNLSFGIHLEVSECISWGLRWLLNYFTQ